MDTNKHSQKRLWIIAGLLVLALIATGTTGCGKATVSGTVDSANQTISGTVNSTFVDVDGLVTAPTRVTTSYPTENLDTEDGRSMFLGGILYTFSDHSDDWSLWLHPESEYPVQKSSLAAFDLTTNAMLWKESVDGTDLVKQGNMLILLRSHAYADEWIDAWQIGRSPDSTKRLWTRQTESTPEEGNITTIAVDSKHVYLQGNKGTFRTLELVSGKEAWKHQFAPSKGPITDGPDVGKPHDTYPTMTLTTTRNVLYVQDGGGLVAGFDPATGKELWNRRISHIQIGQVHTTGWFSLQVVDKGFFVVASDGKVDLWK